ncbi:hypothetical protein [Oceanobacillus polygoni]|uniref:Nuclease with TOPRIM domain n=1 Tax=Oceanobacillus polygoni TaxID=1235259 RepID=A0A9X0YVL4_9BACI|nr:hypothetical protein [Oceanobacillus polygoni]MBP2078846.1 putative nuclease with TOPRIM domain [Oceanobacillus polygoni]
MSQEQLDRMENMLTTLIKTVGTVLEEQTSMKNDITSIKEEQVSMKEEQISMKNDIRSMKEENNARHNEVMEALSIVRADNDLLWEKTNKHERDIGILRKLYEN